MNEELKAKLNEMSLSLIEQIQNGAAWAGEQTNLFVQELIYLHILENSIQFAAFLSLSIMLLVFALYLKKLANKTEDDDDKIGYYFGIFLSLFGSLLIFIPNAIYNGTDICKGIWAPRVVIVEKLKSLL